MGAPLLYGKLAYLWPLLSPPEDYEQEAEGLLRALREALGGARGEGPHSLLDLGVGGGHHLAGLLTRFEVTGVDLSEGMLEHARRIAPAAELIQGDLRTVRIDRRFEAVLMHDAMSYMLCEEDLRAAFATAAAHLGPGGVAIAIPDWFRETFEDANLTTHRARNEDTELVFVEYAHDPDPSDTTVETVMLFLIREGGALRVEQDRHVQGLFPRATWLEIFEGAGFEVTEQPFAEASDGEHSLLIGRLGGSADLDAE